MTRYDIPGAPVWSQEAWTAAEVRRAVEACLTTLQDRLPPAGEWIFVKPDLSSDRPGLSGGTTDFRVLVALLEGLRDRGFKKVMLGDAPPPSYLRAGVSPAHRLRIDVLASRYGVRLLDLNQVPAATIPLPAGEVRVPRAVLEAGLLIDLPTVKTHPEAGLALGTFNLKGLVHSEQRRLLLPHLSSNLLALADRFRPGITLVDGLIAMEGDGPVDGSPVRLGRLFWGGDLLTVDLLVARVLGYTAEEVPHLWRALRKGNLRPEAEITVESKVSVIKDLRRPPARSATHRTGEMVAGWVRGLIRVRSEAPGWRAMAGWMKVRTQVDPRQDTMHRLERHAERCGTCRRCESFCPVGLTREEIGNQPAHDRCISCLYCFQVCGRDALSVQGEGGALLELLNRDKLPLVAM